MRFTLGFVAGVATVFILDAAVYELKRERRKRADERIPFTKWETQDWDDEDDLDAAVVEKWKGVRIIDWDHVDEWLAGS